MINGTAKPSRYLSKSLFTKGLQCHKALYLLKYRPELRDEITESQQALFESGHDVGALAREIFPDGVEVPYEGLSVAEQLAMTAREISGGRKTLYEAAFSVDDIFVKADILHKGTDGWELYEVKSTTEAKPQHLPDLAVQHHVLTGAGIPVARSCLVHLNSQYVRQGGLEISKLFTIEDVTIETRKLQASVIEQVAAMRTMLRGGEPAIVIGPHCDDPYPCDFKGRCWQHVPEDSVFALRGKGANRFDLYHSGVRLLRDIPLDTLNDAQRFQVEAWMERREHVDQEAVRAFLDSLWYPLYFLDFETSQTAIPLYDGTRPYQQIPFQYSLHWQDRNAAELKHSEYLGTPRVDPRPELLKQLLDEIPEDACVVAYNATFEKGRLAELAVAFPQRAAEITRIIDNMRDLMLPFKKRECYHWQMQGSYSLKAVLPALLPELSYKDLEVSDGGMASLAYRQMGETQDSTERERIRQALLEYCKLDTLALARLLEKLRCAGT